MGRGSIRFFPHQFCQLLQIRESFVNTRNINSLQSGKYVNQRLRMAKCPPIISPECRGAKRSARPKGVDTELCGTDTQALPPVLRAFGWRAVLRPEPPCVCCLSVASQPIFCYLIPFLLLRAHLSLRKSSKTTHKNLAAFQTK